MTVLGGPGGGGGVDQKKKIVVTVSPKSLPPSAACGRDP